MQQAPGLTPTPGHGQSCGMGFEPNMATGGALGGVDQHEPSGGSPTEVPYKVLQAWDGAQSRYSEAATAASLPVPLNGSL